MHRAQISLINPYRSIDLGASTWKADTFKPFEIISLDRLSGQLIHCVVPHGVRKYWVTVAYDHVSSAVLNIETYTDWTFIPRSTKSPM